MSLHPCDDNEMCQRLNISIYLATGQITPHCALPMADTGKKTMMKQPLKC